LPSASRRSRNGLQRTQSPSGDCNQGQESWQGGDLNLLVVATHSIPFRGLQHGRHSSASKYPPHELQRTQSPSGDCNNRAHKLSTSVRSPPRQRCNALNPLQGIATSRYRPSLPIFWQNPLSQWLQRTQSPSGDCNDNLPELRYRRLPTHEDGGCNALNPLQGIATRRPPGRVPFETPRRSNPLQRTQSPSGDCNACRHRREPYVRSPVRQAVATHSIPFRGLQHNDRNADVHDARSIQPTALQRTQSPSGDCNSGTTCPATPRLDRSMKPLQRTQSPSGDCNPPGSLSPPRTSWRSRAVATHSIPFRGLQRDRRQDPFP
jgi:hypothetical protein